MSDTISTQPLPQGTMQDDLPPPDRVLISIDLIKHKWNRIPLPTLSVIGNQDPRKHTQIHAGQVVLWEDLRGGARPRALIRKASITEVLAEKGDFIQVKLCLEQTNSSYCVWMPHEDLANSQQVDTPVACFQPPDWLNVLYKSLPFCSIAV
ncbi:hypothetical protein ONZ45_g15529 [Pleurotus djamor]|nr:hypothetical protein ONZ45_g15529 [Pleurotus djamor]